jgi:hypothetical protein
LKRDGTNVVTDSSCKAISGHWVSPYDNVPTTLASDLDIVRPVFFSCVLILNILQDHLVPLKEVNQFQCPSLLTY